MQLIITTISFYAKNCLHYIFTLFNNIVNIMIIYTTPDFIDNSIYKEDDYDEINKETKTDKLNFETIKQLLKNQTLYILGLKPNKNDVVVLKRMYHIFNHLFRNYEINKEKEIMKLNNIISSMLYIPPWDSEDIIFIHLDNLCIFLSVHYPYDEKIEKVITEDIIKISIYEEIDKILEL